MKRCRIFLHFHRSIRLLCTCIAALMLYMPSNSYGITADAYYIDQSIFNAGNQCLTDLGSKKPRYDELKKLAFLLLDLRDSSGISADVSMAAMTTGVASIRERYSCSQILELYQRLYNKYGLSGAFVE